MYVMANIWAGRFPEGVRQGDAERGGISRYSPPIRFIPDFSKYTDETEGTKISIPNPDGTKVQYHKYAYRDVETMVRFQMSVDARLTQDGTFAKNEKLDIEKDDEGKKFRRFSKIPASESDDAKTAR